MARAPSTLPRPRITAATRRRMDLRNQIWPDVRNDELWDRREFTGFTTIPRTLSIIMRIIDELDNKNAGRVYFDLWCRSFDDYVIEIRDEYEAAYSSGYGGQRAVRSWRERVAVLESAGFVKAQKASHGAYRLVLIVDPHEIVEKLHQKRKVSEESWLALNSLMISIGSRRRTPS